MAWDSNKSTGDTLTNTEWNTHVNDQKFLTVTTTTINYAILTTDKLILANGEITVTLPTAVSATGKVYNIKKINSSGNVTIATTSSQTIDGSLTLVLSSQYDSVTLVSNGSNWLII